MFKKIILAGLLAVGLAGSAHAVTLSMDSTITFGGTLAPGTNLATATAIDFQPTSFVTSSSGDLASVAVGSLASFNDFSFSPFTGTSNPVWNVGGFSFDLSSVGINAQNANTLALMGFGFISGNGFDASPVDFSMSADTASGRVFAFSATNSTVPEPGTLLLLGSGLVFLAWNRRKKLAAVTA